jgi:hypothetical protein
MSCRILATRCMVAENFFRTNRLMVARRSPGTIRDASHVGYSRSLVKREFNSSPLSHPYVQVVALRLHNFCRAFELCSKTCGIPFTGATMEEPFRAAARPERRPQPLAAYMEKRNVET